MTDCDQSSPTLVVERGIGYLSLNRPERKNALRLSDRQQITDLLHSADRDADVDAVVLRGSGGTFCAGGDVSEFGHRSEIYEALEYGDRVAQQVFRQLRAMTKPTIACVEGAAAGAGMLLALTCDIVVADLDAYFVASQISIGIPPDWGAMWTLPRLVGLARAKSILLTGRRVSAETAAAWGLIAEAVPSSDLDSCVRSYVSDIQGLSTGALSLTLRGLNASFDMGPDAFCAYESVAISAGMVSEEHRAGVARFLQRSQSRGKEDTHEK